MAYPNATVSSNHGLAFEGYAPDTSLNGLMVMAETGITPKFGASELPGKYAMGGYYWGNQKDSFNGTYNWGQYGFYWQADQMLFREPSPEEPAPLAKGPSDGKSTVDSKSGKSFKAPVKPNPSSPSRVSTPSTSSPLLRSTTTSIRSTSSRAWSMKASSRPATRTS